MIGPYCAGLPCGAGQARVVCEAEEFRGHAPTHRPSLLVSDHVPCSLSWASSLFSMGRYVVTFLQQLRQVRRLVPCEWALFQHGTLLARTRIALDRPGSSSDSLSTRTVNVIFLSDKALAPVQHWRSSSLRAWSGAGS